MAPKVIALPGVTLEEFEKSPCPLCGVALGRDAWTCKRCDRRYHIECFWSRIATMDEWTMYVRRVMETDDDFEADVVCATCRPKDVCDGT